MSSSLSSFSASVNGNILPDDEPRTTISSSLSSFPASVNGDILPGGEPRTTLSSNRVSESCYDDESDEDGTYQGMLLDNESEAEYGGFGDEEQVVVASDSYRWKINHSKGDHRLKGQCSYRRRVTVAKKMYTVQDLIEKTSLSSFDGVQAIDMLQRSYTMDYGNSKAGSRPAAEDDQYLPAFHLDFLMIIGRPLKPIIRPNDHFFDNVTVTFKNWRAPYSSKHLHGLPFDLQHRTFRLATGATREAWFIVMHPIAPPVAELVSSRRERRKRLEKSSQSSALEVDHARFLAEYIKQVFLDGDLLGEGIEPSWRLDGLQVQNITFNKWTTFQTRFMEGWLSYVAEQPHDDFWTENQPAFHAYDYGANIEIEVNEQLQNLPKETRLRQSDEESDEEEDEEQEDRVESPPASPTQSTVATDVEEIDYGSLYTEGIRQLRTELEKKYVLENISNVSYALAVDINCLDGRSPDPDNKFACCLLADRNAVVGEFSGSRDFTFYPLAFHPAYGNFSSPRPPSFITDNLLTIIRDNMSFQNDGADVLSCGYFQAYSNIKRNIRHGPDDLLATKGIATAALTLPEAEAFSSHTRAKRDRLLQRLRGELTPENPDSSKPFAREGQQVAAAIEAEEFAFRMEQVLSVQVSKLTEERRNFSTVLNPIFQMIRFFLKEPHRYAHLLRSFPPSVFPGVLCSFASIFNLAMDELYRRFEATGSKGLNVALAEGVAAIDRLGSYCFTGHPRSLMGSVLGPLGVIDGIRFGAWPYMNPRMLDIQKGSISLSKWPRDENGRPILMHAASISYHYGPEVGASRHSNVWFTELGGMAMEETNGGAQFLEELFHDLWVPQMVVFIRYQLSHTLKVTRPRGANEVERRREFMKQWSECSSPFSWA